MNRERIAELARFYRKHLLDDVMPFWEANTADTEYGGYLTCFDPQGHLLDTDKYIWMQGRQLWMFSALYNRVEPRPQWLELARRGRDFLVEHAYAGKGRWQYQLDRSGRHVKRGTISIYTDHFALAGLCEYALAGRSREDTDLIRETFAVMEHNVHDPDFKDIFHGTWSPRYKRHGIHMISVNVADVASRVLGAERTTPLINHCLQEILYVFANDARKLLFESVGRDGQVIDEPEGRLINPGHALESMWFCMEVARQRGDERLPNRCVEITDWMYGVGRDIEHGGIFSYLDASGREPPQTDWHRETGMRWDDKVWWVHSEALYALAMCAVLKDTQEWWARFLDLHEYCRSRFSGAPFGQWHTELFRDGTPKPSPRSVEWRSAFHLPRALMMITILLENAARTAA